MKKKTTLTLFLTLFISLTIFANNSPFVRYPALNSNGSQLAFSFQGDIWSVATNGGKATRLTIHEAYDGNPYWSNDDKNIAFSSNRYGNYDIFLMSKDGGFPTRLTYHSANDVITDFTSQNNLLFTTSRLFNQVEWDGEIESVSVNGGTPVRALDAVGNMAVQSPNGKFIAFVRGWGRVEREKYNGSADLEIWIYNTESKEFNQITDNEVQDIYPRWASDNALYFISARSGKYNIHQVGIDANGNAAKDVAQITDFKETGPRYFNISKNASTLAMEVGTDIYTMKLGSGTPQKVEINIDSDYRFDPVVNKSFSGDLTEYSVSPNGKYSSLVIRGEIFVTENDKEKSLTINLSNHPYRDQNVAWVNDSTLIFISDRDGQFDLYSLVSSDKKESNLFKSMKHKITRLTNTKEDESNPIISPDNKKVIYQIGRGKLVAADISANGELSNETDLLDGWATPEGISWSPDSKWIAYSLSDLEFNDEVFIHPVDNSIKPVNVSMHPRGDYSPVWSKDGSKLGFISQRSNSDLDIWFAWLKKSDWDKTKEDWEYSDEEKKPSKDKKKGADSTLVEPIKIDIDKIYERLVRVTSLQGNESDIQFSKDGKTIYFTASALTEKGKDIYSIKFDGTDIKEITKGGKNPSGLTMDKEFKYIYFSPKGKLSRLDIKSGKDESLPFNGKMDINFAEEENQIFEESWRALRDGFYDPNFHNNNWDDLKDKYKPMCLKASTQKDFQDMYNIMLGELNASHMGMRYANDRTDLQKEKTGLIGAELIAVKNGVKVLRVVPNSPADREQSKLLAGDIITHVNGTEVKNGTNIYSLLANTSEEKTLLNIDRKGEDLEIVIRPTASLRTQLYDEWVENNRKLVDKWSNGKIGYLHIESMGMESFERFEREFTAVGSGKDAIVIDVRYNGGGWTTDYLMTILNYKQHAYTIPRGAAKDLEKEKKNFRNYYPIGERLPFAAWTKPSIAICNQNSYSNAEIFSHAYKNLGIGTLVGVPTFGAVISTGSKTLIDGSTIRMPSRGWYVKADDKNMDFVPAIPDIIVNDSPDEKVTGNDAQLKRAVDELLKQIQ
ncbi:MAG: PDZ domain-containing protein [Bacteroidetes bacterium]|nr:PDZ domain-containing protein [Bacteroidota bacterium]MBU1799441.1 PDZ domain-containing protein [Bacteroidota bacterium]